MKQETLEEAMERLSNIVGVGGISDKHAFMLGTFWQQERSYSEEEVNEMFDTLKRNAIDNVATISNVDLFINSWKQQFKKR